MDKDNKGKVALIHGLIKMPFKQLQIINMKIENEHLNKAERYIDMALIELELAVHDTLRKDNQEAGNKEIL